MAVMPGAEPFASDPEDGSRDIGVVLSHGLTGTPQSMRPWGEYLAAQGIGVRGPRLPGHGTRWQDLNRTRWTDWYGEVSRAVDDLAGQYRSVFVFGLSMGHADAAARPALPRSRRPARPGLGIVDLR